MTDLRALQERAKELRCLYAVDSVLADRSLPPARMFPLVVREMPAGWQEPEETGARVLYLGHVEVGPGFSASRPSISEPLRIWGTEVGRLEVSGPEAARASFLPEEAELLARIARRLGEYLEWKHAEFLGERTPPDAMHWAWRQRYAEALADTLDAERFVVRRLYLGGSTARGDARHGSDIDLYIECEGSAAQKAELSAWLEGFGHCLAQVARERTGETFPAGILNIQWLEAPPSVWRRQELQELRLTGRA